MAVQLVTDLVLDVARAADPGKVAEARAALNAGASAAANAVASVFDVPAASPRAAVSTAATPKATATTLPAKGPAEQFEAFVLQNFVESMLPSQGDSVYGAGLAGDMWKSMLAEQIAMTMARDGGVGITNRLLADYTRVEDRLEPVSGVRDAGGAPGETRAADIVRSYVDQQTRSFLDAVHRADE